jgi:hypothetical protein
LGYSFHFWTAAAPSFRLSSLSHESIDFEKSAVIYQQLRLTAAHRGSEKATVGFRQSEIATDSVVAAQYRSGFVTARKVPSAKIFQFSEAGEIFRILTPATET